VTAAGTEGPDDGLWRTLGAAARLWADPTLWSVGDQQWRAFSDQRNVNYNLACCHTGSAEVLTRACLEPLLERKKPGIIMLSGPGLAAAPRLREAEWVCVGALPLMVLAAPASALAPSGPPESGVVRLDGDALAPARALVADTYGLDDASAAAAYPDRVVEDGDMGLWGLYSGDRLVSTVSTVVEGGLVVVWSMATRADSQRQGHGRRLLAAVLDRQFAAGASGSLLNSSAAGERLYRALGYRTVEYLQLWSRPRWVLASG
jgi:GNAT superfamily N-acetyltransferase